MVVGTMTVVDLCKQQQAEALYFVQVHIASLLNLTILALSHTEHPSLAFAAPHAWAGLGPWAPGAVQGPGPGCQARGAQGFDKD